jgi:uncharacterized spore protein YtfJ
MDVQAVITQARDTLTVDRVFGQPYERNGVKVLPVASVRGGGGGGGGPTGGGGGGVEARPAGAFVISGDVVRWQPAVDANRVLVFAAVALLVIRSIVRTRAKTKRALARRAT